MTTATRIVKRSCRTCGWSGAYDSAARADYAKRKHSCAKQIAKAQAEANGEKLRASIDRTPKPCTHKIAQHQHGTYACYVLDRCRCNPCAAARAAYGERDRKDKAYGRWNRYVPADDARAHVRRLQALGMGWKRIARAAGIETSVVWKLLYGDRTRNLAPSKRIRPATADAILAVELDLAPGARIDSTGTARRIQALCALGYSLSQVGDQVGILRSNFTDIAHGRGMVTVATATAIRDLYDRWAMTIPPTETRVEKYRVSRAKNYATANGWVPPLAWDDDTIDDPKASHEASPTPAPSSTTVDQSAVDRATSGDVADRLGIADRREAVRTLHAQGLNDSRIAARIGVSSRTVLRIRQRLNLPPVSSTTKKSA